jgi:hypothetical protein
VHKFVVTLLENPVNPLLDLARCLGLNRRRPIDGASAVPAGELVTRSRAALGISPPVLRSAREVLPGLGQEMAGNARLNRVPGRMAWS